jgi:Tol biopolymer transport system component
VTIAVKDGARVNLTSSFAESARNPAPSPDGSRIAVASGRGIVILDRSGEVIETIDSGLRDRFPAWNRDGSSVAFAADRNPILTID